ncbi:MAG: hypothetical protein E7256_11075 [Lachnospiraceae bacterium]|nr:hypothetical protein [Lachnospiraceae bacterium]
MKELLIKIWKKDWTEEEKLIIMAMTASLGMVLGLTCGFVLSPAKNGFHVFSGNGCNNESISKIRQSKKEPKKKAEKK